MNPLEQQTGSDQHDGRATMSACADGQADAADAALALWASDAQARQAWHEYHLIGDALRSDELAAAAAHDEAFLLALRGRLAAEPAIVAPLPGNMPARAGTPSHARRRWSMAAAAAAVVTVGGALMAVQISREDTRLAQQPQAAPEAPLASRADGPVVSRVAGSGLGATAGQVPVGAPASVAARGPSGYPQWRMLDGQVIRDARLEAYFRAHRGSGAVSGRLETVVLER